MSAARKVVDLAAYRAPAPAPEKKPSMQDGFLAIPNELMDALLAADLTGRQLKLALAIVRKTIGYGKVEDDCTITQLAEVAGLHRPNASKALQQLLDMNVVSARKGRHGQLVSVNAPSSWNLDPVQNDTPTDTNVSKQYAEPYQNETHNRQYQNTSTTPPVSPSGDQPSAADVPAKPKRPPRAKSAKVTFAQWRDTAKASGEKLIPESDPVFEYAADAGISIEFLQLAWVEFREAYKDNGKQYADWRAVFRTCVRRNWYRLWFLKPDGTCELTTAGVQAMNAAEARKKQEAK